MKKIFILFTIIVLSINNVFAGENTSEAILQYNHGIDYYKIGQYDNAITAFRTAIKLDPNYIDAYYNLGTVLECLHQYDAALAVFKQVIVRKPEDYDSVYKAAWISYKMGDYQKAKTYLSIIPPNCSRTKDAQELAEEMDFTLTPKEQNKIVAPKTQELKSTSTISLSPAPVKTAPPQPQKTVNQTSGIYQNIPAPTGITSDKEGNLYIAQFNNNSIIKITPDNKKVLYQKSPKISGPIGMVIDKNRNLYIANYNNDNILKINSLGEISVLISNVKKPYCLYIDNNMLFVSCQGSNSVLRYKLP